MGRSALEEEEEEGEEEEGGGGGGRWEKSLNQLKLNRLQLCTLPSAEFEVQ
jgi:hypothetical protein